MEKSVKNITKFDYRTMKYCNLYIIKYKRKAFILYLVLTIATLAIAVYTFIKDMQSEKATYIFPILFVAFAAYMIYQGLTIEKMLDRQLTQYFYNRKVSDQIVVMSDEKLVVTRSQDGTETAPVDVDWSQITEIHEIPQFYFLFLQKNTPIVIDKNPECMVEGTLEDMKIIIEEKAKMKPYKFVNKEIVTKPITYVHHDVVVEDAPTEAVSVENEIVSEKPENSNNETQDTADLLTDDKNDNQVLDDVNKEK